MAFEEYLGKIMTCEQAYNTFVDHEYIMINLKKNKKTRDIEGGKVVCVSNSSQKLSDAIKRYNNVKMFIGKGRESIPEVGGIC